MTLKGKVCSLGLWDESVPNIRFDDDGVSNYAMIQKILMGKYPRGEKGLLDWNDIVDRVKKTGKNKRYDCAVGVSGGVDSSYLLHLLKKEYKLNPLAVTVDNGWSSDIAVKNIKKMTDALDIDLETYVIDYEEIKDLFRSYMIASLAWVDMPTDMAIKSVMYKIALKENIKYIFRGNDFRTEGKQPREWTYGDNKMLKFIHKKYGKIKKLKTYPYLPFSKIIYGGFVRNIKDIRPFYYLDYSKSMAKDFLQKEYDWQDYGGHHHENLFTKYTMSCWLPEKFNIDKRIINLSAQVMSGYITRTEAVDVLNKPALSVDEKRELSNYIKKKLDISDEEYANIMSSKNKSFRDYPNNEKNIKFLLLYFRYFIKLVYPQKPMTFVEMEVNK